MIRHQYILLLKEYMNTFQRLFELLSFKVELTVILVLEKKKKVTDPLTYSTLSSIPYW